MMIEKLLVPREKYLSAGVHIGMTTKTAGMNRFIYKVRSNGLSVLNIGLVDERIQYAANLIAGTKNVLVVSQKDNAKKPAEKFAEAIGARAITTRFMPGSMTNPSYKEFFEPELVIVADPLSEKRVIREAAQMRIPIIGLSDTYNETTFLDYIIPCNNKGKKSLALIFWLLTKTVSEKKNPKKEFKLKPEDFGYE